MKQGIFVLAMILSMALSGCSGNQAEDLFETAKLEELQDNQEHAKKLYEEIIRDYPGSEYAKDAQARLSALEQGQ